MNEYAVYRTAAWLSRHLPEKLAYWFGLRVADRFYSFNRKGREAVVSNLRKICAARGVEPAEDALDGLARKVFQYFGKYLIDFFRYARLTPDSIRRRISFEHREYLDQILAMKRGALLVTAHLGNWELGGAVLAALGYKVNVVVLPSRLDKLNRMFQRQREQRGVNVIPVGQSAFGIVRCLRNREIVAMLVDRDFTMKDDRIPFFGQPARIPRGPAWMSAKLGVPVLPVFLLRQVDDTFLLRFYPPILPEQEGSAEAIRLKIARILEREIGDQPYQWFIFDDFWNNHEGLALHTTKDHETGKPRQP